MGDRPGMETIGGIASTSVQRTQSNAIEELFGDRPGKETTGGIASMSVQRTQSNAIEELFMTKGKMSKDERAALAKRKEEWAESCTMDDVVFNNDMTAVIEIRHVPISNWVIKMLIKFCRKNGMKVAASNQTKDVMLKKIVLHKKSEGTMAIMSNAIKKRTNKGTIPSCVKQEGSYYRAILTITSDVMKETYLRTMSKRTKADLDSGKIPYYEEWEALLNYYLDNIQYDRPYCNELKN